jgi:hypothetical protein
MRSYINPLLFFSGICGLFAVFFLGINAISWLLPPNMPPIASFLLFLFTVLLFLLLCCQINVYYLVFVEKEFQDNPEIRYLFLAAMLLTIVMMYLAAHHWLIRSPLYYMLYTANLFFLANLVGVWIIRPLKREAELIMICLVMALADLFSIIRGPTRHVVESIQTYYQSDMEGPPPISDFLLIKMPVVGLDHLNPLFGVSDWIIIVFLSAAAAHFHINDNMAGKSIFTMVSGRKPVFYFPVAVGGLLAALFAASILNLFIPALPLVALSFTAFLLLRYPAARQLKPSDWRIMGLFSGAMLALLVIASVLAG